MKGKKFKVLSIMVIMLISILSSTYTSMAVSTTNPEGGDLITLMDFDTLTDLGDVGIEPGAYVQDTDFTLDLMDDGAGDSGKYIKYVNTNTASSDFVRMTLNLNDLGISTTDFSAYDELWFWQQNTFGIFGLYIYVELITNDDKIFWIPNGGDFNYGNQSIGWTSAVTIF